jgi:hypothetical protein
MTDNKSDEPVDTGSLDTEAFRAFANREEPEPKASGVPFRLLTLGAGLVVFCGLALLLLRG